MEVFLLLLLFPCPTAQDGLFATILSATSRSNPAHRPPEHAIDNNLDNDFYHSNSDIQPEWLKLTLTGKSNVEKVVIVNR